MLKSVASALLRCPFPPWTDGQISTLAVFPERIVPYPPIDLATGGSLPRSDWSTSSAKGSSKW